MKYLIALLLAVLTLCAFIKRTYKYATVQDTVEPPIDYKDTQAYKDNEPWFTGMGRCWMIFLFWFSIFMFILKLVGAESISWGGVIVPFIASLILFLMTVKQENK